MSFENAMHSALIDPNLDPVANELQDVSGIRPLVHRDGAQSFGLHLPSLSSSAMVLANVGRQQKTVGPERLLNAREVAESLGVSERWVRDHTTRRSPRIRGIKLGTLIRYRRADVEIFMEKLNTQTTSRQNRFGV